MVTSARPLYSERLSPSLWYLTAAAIAGPMLGLVFIPTGTTTALLIGIAASIAIVTLLFFAAPKITVRSQELQAGRARINVKWLGEGIARSGAEAQQARGPGLSARSWHLIRGGIDALVEIPVVDPADPITSWTLSSRTPDRLLAAIRRAQNTSND